MSWTELDPRTLLSSMKWLGLPWLAIEQCEDRQNLLRNTTIASKTIPPRLTIAVENSTLRSRDFKVSSSDLDEWIIGVEVLPEGCTFESNLGTGLELGQIDG
jgi:hypothetical protein